MTLEEAIKHCEEHACGNTRCAIEHRQIAECLKELQRLKSLSPNLDELLEWAKEREAETRDKAGTDEVACAYHDAIMDLIEKIESL